MNAAHWWGAVLVSSKERPVHSRTQISLKFLVRLPSVEVKGRWRERGKMLRGE
jgi:hypothetical protein